MIITIINEKKKTKNNNNKTEQSSYRLNLMKFYIITCRWDVDESILIHYWYAYH